MSREPVGLKADGVALEGEMDCEKCQDLGVFWYAKEGVYPNWPSEPTINWDFCNCQAADDFVAHLKNKHPLKPCLRA